MQQGWRQNLPIAAFLVALLTLLFGNNIVQQVTGKLVFVWLTPEISVAAAIAMLTGLGLSLARPQRQRLTTVFWWLSVPLLAITAVAAAFAQWLLLVTVACAAIALLHSLREAGVRYERTPTGSPAPQFPVVERELPDYSVDEEPLTPPRRGV